jgi:multidrug efflux system membrane fusion protein
VNIDVAPTAVVVPHRSRRRRWRFVALVFLAVLVGVGLWLFLNNYFKPAPVAVVPPIPVVVAAALASDVPVYFNGIGSVQAYNTVTVHSRVDGELMEVAFVEGQDVKAGQVLARIDPRTYQAQLDQVTATKAKDEALLADARLDLERYINLGNRVTGQILDTQRALVKQVEATVRVDQANIDNARTLLGYCTIASPIDGRTGYRLVDKGNIVHATDVNGLVVVTQIQPISVLFTLPEDDFEMVNRQMATGPLAVAASGRADNEVLDQGTLLLINNQIDQTTGTIQLKATFPNLSRTLWPGQFVNARLLVETRQGAVTVPAAAVQRGPQGVYAFVVKADNKAQMLPIKVSTANLGGPTVLIDSGIAAGDQVVIDGQLKLRAGASVKLVPSAALSPSASLSPSAPLSP